MQRYYFTFDKGSEYPYQSAYLTVVASSYSDVVRGFNERHPDVSLGCMNCSGCYNEEQWADARKKYPDCSLTEIIVTETCFGKKPTGYRNLLIYVLEMRQVVRAEGSGDNLLPEDVKEGYVDYIYEQYGLGIDMSEVDGGQILLEKLQRDECRCIVDCLLNVLDMAYGCRTVVCMIL